MESQRKFNNTMDFHFKYTKSIVQTGGLTPDFDVHPFLRIEFAHTETALSAHKLARIISKSGAFLLKI